ncbi:hypothetical protein HK104_002028 [Borealophlyctis nickersoniae]|nr:hypothetical protein HK104_002028 [Borealophlyctis nickersoniae]
MNGDYDEEHIVIPNRPNIRVLRKKNECFDLGSWPMAIEYAERGRRAPFCQVKIVSDSHLEGAWSDDCWSDLFFDRLNEEVKIVGLSWNCQIRPHIQSMLLALDPIALDIVSPFFQCYEDKHEAIRKSETQMTAAVREKGYKAEVLMTGFYSTPDYADTCEGQGERDPWWLEDAYFGMDFHMYETIFYKSNRHLAIGHSQEIIHHINIVKYDQEGKYITSMSGRK